MSPEITAVIVMAISFLWLVLTVSPYSIYIAMNPGPPKTTYKSVIWGVAMTAPGGMGIQYAVGVIIWSLFDLPPLPVWVVIVLLIAPWVSFPITGPIMIIGQKVKYDITDGIRHERRQVVIPKEVMDDEKEVNEIEENVSLEGET